MKKYFITATGTGIGKTLITSALAYQLSKQGKRVKALKPVISGFDAANAHTSDTGQLLEAQGLPVTPENVNIVSPWRFKAPLSPDMAAADERKRIDFNALNGFCRQQEDYDALLIEGVGGVMVPLTESQTTLDWMQALQYPVILVAGSYLGSISHTLTACQALLSRGLALDAVVISESEVSPAPLQRISEHLQRFLPDNSAIYTVTRLDSSPELWKTVPDITPILK